jgi:hypothetical protein
MPTYIVPGTSGNDALLGTDASDELQGLEGNDTLSGGLGIDGARYSGNSAGYQLQRNSAGQWTVADLDLANGNEGFDVLDSIEWIYFSDGAYNLRFSPRPIGGQFQANTYIPGNQLDSAVAGLENGGFVVAWYSETQDPDHGVYGQRFTANGERDGTEFRINTTTTGSQQRPSIATLTDGSFVATWQSENQDGSGWGAYGQRFAADGSVLGSEFRINTYTSNHQSDPVICELSGGGFVVAWNSLHQDGSSWGAYFQRYDAAGQAVGQETSITISSYDQSGVTLTAIAGGGFLAAWHSTYQDGSGMGIYGRRFAEDGTALTDEFLINTTTAFDQSRPAVAGLHGGGFVVVWESQRQDGDSTGIYAQCFAADGSKLGQEFRVNSWVSSHQLHPAVAATQDGGFLALWMSAYQDGSGWGCYGQKFDSEGVPVGKEFKVNQVVTHDQLYPQLSVLDTGDVVVTWTSAGPGGPGSEIYVQRYSTLPVFNESPVLTDASPRADARHVPIGHPIVLTFSETIQRGTGNFVLKTASGSVVESFDSATSANLSFAGNTLTIDPAANLSYITGYSLEIPQGAVTDLAGNAYAGTSTYNFSTQVDPATPVLRPEHITDAANQIYYKGHIYEFVAAPGGMAWAAARDAATSRSIQGVPGHLVTLTSAEENAIVHAAFFERVTANQSIGLGGSDLAEEGVWRWVGGPEIGQIFEYSNWAPGEPNNGWQGTVYTNDVLAFLSAAYNPPTGTWADDFNQPIPGAGGYMAGYIVEYSGAPLPADDVHRVYHWKSHMLLSGVQIGNMSAHGGAADNALFDVREARYDAATGVLSMQIWSTSATARANFDFSVDCPGATSASFVCTLSGSWTVLANTTTPSAVSVGGFDANVTGFSGATQLGTLTLQYPPGSNFSALNFNQIAIGTETVADLALNFAGQITGIDGGFTLPDDGSGSTMLQITRGTSDTGSAITSADALAALRIAVGLNPNSDPDGAGPLHPLRVSPYQIMAADANGSGKVTSADALEVLKMAVNWPGAVPNEWLFVEETRDFWNEASQQYTLTRDAASWDRTVFIDGSASPPIGVVGMLKGDVNGSWSAPAGSVDLDTIDPNYFTNLANRMNVPTDQWGV